MAVVPTSWCTPCENEQIAVFLSTDAHVIVDLVGVFDYLPQPDALRFYPSTPTRIVDTRENLGIGSPLGPSTSAPVTVPADVAPPGTRGLALNVTAVLPSSLTFVTVWPGGVARPNVSNLNPALGRIVPNSVYTMLGTGNVFHVYNNGGQVNVVVDVVGRFATPGIPGPH